MDTNLINAPGYINNLRLRKKLSNIISKKGEWPDEVLFPFKLPPDLLIQFVNKVEEIHLRFTIDSKRVTPDDIIMSIIHLWCLDKTIQPHLSPLDQAFGKNYTYKSRKNKPYVRRPPKEATNKSENDTIKSDQEDQPLTLGET